ncbi:zinc ribbon domain-containing protein [Candidatus Solincola tengchongensis]|uniref:zinc ribbon domain-containing protein n=1 Tax=Candidatus Solincola tengchongensis TaxID=2900693 RepID=UPI00257EE1F0|nr:zinc ribbon domain-containing protein [Candidatus Solincola tengchongensis]
MTEKRYYCPQCLSYGEAGAEFCTSCGAKLVPLMRIVIMPFVESGQEPEDLGEYGELVSRDGELSPAMAIGCQLYMQSDLERSRLMASQKEFYFREAERMLPRLVKSYLEPMVFYEVPDPDEVERIADEAADVPTELFVIIQNRYDPEYLFLPEIDYFFFRYPRLHTSGTGPDSGFGFVRLSAFLLDNRENRIVSRGSGSGLELYRPPEAVLDENFNVSLEEQMEVMRLAASRAVESLLQTMKMIK